MKITPGPLSLLVSTACLWLAPAFAATKAGEKRASPKTDAGLLRAYADSFFAAKNADPTQEAFEFIGEVYQKNGASIRTSGDPKYALNLAIKPYTEIINSYDSDQAAIEAAAMPTAAQSEAYWSNWNRVLARGKWDYKKFFRNRKGAGLNVTRPGSLNRIEMFTMARYNVLVLTAHEYGHYFDYRYNISDYDYRGFALTTRLPLNCTEYFADKFAIAFINYLSQDARFAALRKRYYALINDFNNSLPKANRVSVRSFDQLENDCDSINLLANGLNRDGSVNDYFFRTYASAYFGRHRVLLDKKDFPSLRTLISETLTSRLPKAAEYTSDTVSIRRIGEATEPNDETKFAIHPSGALWQFDIRESRADGPLESLALIVRDSKGAVQGKINFVVPVEERDKFDLYPPLILNDNEFIVPLVPDIMEVLINGKKFETLYFLRAQRKSGGGWSTKFQKLVGLPHVNNDTSFYSWALTPGGKFLLFRHANSDVGGTTSNSIYKYEFDSSDIGSAESHLPDPELIHQGAFNFPITLANDSGRFFGSSTGQARNNRGDRILEVGKTSAPILLGNGLDGFTLANAKTRVELSNTSASRFIDDSTILIMNNFNNAGKTHYLVHEIKIK